MADALKWSVARHGNKPIMGTREIIAELDEVQPNGRMFKKDFIQVYNRLYQGNGEIFAYEIFKLYDVDYGNDYIDFKVKIYRVRQ